MWGAGCRVQGAGCRVQGVGCRVQGAGCRVQGTRFRVQVLRGTFFFLPVSRLVSQAAGLLLCFADGSVTESGG
jgi:hypothetical protein